MSAKKPLPAHMEKANILEDVVAMLHEDPEVLVQQKVKMPTRSNPKRTREIDVLVTGRLIDYPIRLAFECKNYAKKIGVAEIGKFSDSLSDVGIPVQHGIYVTAGDYTSGSRERAADLGIRLLRLEGLTKDRLAAEVHAAFQSVIFLLAEVVELNFSGITTEESVLQGDLMQLRDANREDVGMIYDLIWAKWRDGKVPLTLGHHRVGIDLPPGWQWLINGSPLPIRADAVVGVRAILATQPGKAERFLLRDARTSDVERGHMTTSFELDEEGRATMEPENIFSEDELKERIASFPGITQVYARRIQLPRIVIEAKLYWPPSLKAALRVASMHAEMSRAGTWFPDAFEPFSLDDIEGTDLLSVWDEIAPDHPAASDPSWPWPKKPSRGRHATPKGRPTKRTRPRGNLRRKP